MDKIKIITICLLLFGAACTKNSQLKLDCTIDMLKQRNMVKFRGQEIGCKFFLTRYNYNSKHYYLLGNHCTGMAVFPMDCEGNILCDNGSDDECQDFFSNATRIGIVGVDE